MNWNGGGRNTPTNCGPTGNAGNGGRGGRRGGAAGGNNGAAAGPNAAPATPATTNTQPATGGGGQAGPEAFFGGRGGTPMRVRVKVTAGEHTVGATFLATNFAPLLDLLGLSKKFDEPGDLCPEDYGD